MNFVSANTTQEQIQQYLGGFVQEEIPVTVIQGGWTMAHALVFAGVFPSTSQARKNGFGGEIPLGYSELRIGKKHHFWFLNDLEAFELIDFSSGIN